MAANQTNVDLNSFDQDSPGLLYPNGYQQPNIETIRKALHNQPPYKRERSQNWEQTEKFVLARLVQKHLGVIEDKAVDTDAVQRRKQAWQEIHDEFTAKIGSRAGRVSRSVQRIREQWRRMKYWAKHEVDAYLESRVEFNGRVRYTKKPNELAQYINGMMAAVERTNHGHQVVSCVRLSNDLHFEDGSQDTDLPPSQLSLPDPQPDSHQEQNIDTSHETNLKEDETPVAMETPHVKQESVEVLEENESGVVVTVSSIQPSDDHSPPRLSPNQQMRDPTSYHTSANSSLPGWTRDFPEITGEPTAPRPPPDEDNEEDESDFLDDSEDEEMMGSYLDWGRGIPITATPPTRLPSIESNTSSKLERQQQLHARWEFKRRMQMMEEEHARRMQILEIQRETAQMKKKLIFRQLIKSRTPSASVTNPYGRRVPLQR